MHAGDILSDSLDSYGAPLSPEFLDHNPDIKFYPESSIKTFGSYQPDIPAEPIRKPANPHRPQPTGFRGQVPV
jgi:hypothetical protein